MTTPPVNRTQIILLLVMAGFALGIIYFGYSVVMRTLPSMQPTAVPSLPSTQAIQDTPIIQTPTYTVQPVKQPPDILEFNVSPFEIPSGSCLTIGWDVSINAKEIRIERENEIIYDGASMRGEINDCPLTSGVLTYNLEASNAEGITTDQAEVMISEPTPTPSSPLIKNWSLLFYRNADGRYISPITGTKINAKFLNDRSIGGFSGCNTYNGSFILNDPGLTINNLEKSEKNCFDIDGVMAQEEVYLMLFSSTSSFIAGDDQLELYNANGEKILVFTACDDASCQ